MDNKDLYLTALAANLCVSSTDFWKRQRASGMEPKAFLDSLTTPTTEEKEEPAINRFISACALEIRSLMHTWVTFFKGRTLKNGYCDKIAGQLGDALAQLNLVRGWDGSGFSIWEMFYTPTGVPWEIHHFALPVRDGDRVFLVDIPMKEYCRFDLNSQLWIGLDNPTFEVHVIHTAEDFMAAYPGMTRKQAEFEVSELPNMFDDPCFDLEFTSNALAELSGGRYYTAPQDHAALETAGQQTLSF